MATNPFTIEDKQLIALIKERYRLPSDNSAALLCRVDPSLVHAVMKGTKGLGPKARLKFFDKAGYAWARDALLHLFPEEAAIALADMDQDNTKRLIQEEQARRHIEASAPPPASVDAPVPSKRGKRSA